MSYTVSYMGRLTKAQAAQCEALQLAVGPVNGKAPRTGGRAWLAVDEAGMVVGFATARREARGRVVAIANTVVAPHARGNGLQKRLTRRIIAWAMEHGAEAVHTHTAADNWHSAANLVECGFRVTRLEAAPGGEDTRWVCWRWGVAA